MSLLLLLRTVIATVTPAPTPTDGSVVWTDESDVSTIWTQVTETT
jgi:hypothetical protein